MKAPLTTAEEILNELIVQANNTFVNMEQTHPSDLIEWNNSIHKLQHIVMARMVRREFPETYVTIKNNNHGIN